MILGNSGMSNLVSSQGVGGVSAVSIANSPHMFTILSSGLYSDKIAAVLREVGCNAMDAHIMSAQPDKPIQVKLPSTLDRTFYVKDWGPGLDDKEFRQLYTTYGWSNKQNRNDATGAFGLGSKSPFAYTMQNREASDGYTVETAKDGSLRVYTVFIGDDGTPQVALLHEGPSSPDWPHGLKVTFPVQTSDIDEFHQKAQTVFQWFNIKPEVLGIRTPLREPEFRVKGSFYGLAGSNDAQAGVVMGNVRYPLHLNRLKDLHPVEMAIARGITLFLPLGSVMMTPSREELEYTSKTRETVQEWLSKAVKDIAATIREAVMEPAETQWLWSRKVLSYVDQLPWSIKASSLGELLAYAGVNKEDAARINDMVNNKAAALPFWVGDVNFRGQVEIESGQAPDNACRVYHYRSEFKEVRRYTVHLGYSSYKGDRKKDEAPRRLLLPYTADIAVFEADSTLPDARIKELVRTSGKSVLLVMGVKGTSPEYVRDYARRLATCRELEGIEFGKTSELPVPAAHEEAKQRAKERRATPLRKLMADNEVNTWNLKDGSLKGTATLGEFQDGQLFYVFGNPDQASWKASVHTFMDDERLSVRCGSSYESQNVAAVNRLLSRYVGELSHVALVRSPGAARRLRLDEQGFQPLFNFLTQKVKDDTELQALTKRKPTSQLNADMQTLGTLGEFMKAKMDLPLWSALKARPGLERLLKYVENECSSYEELSEDEQKLRGAAMRLMGSGIKSSAFEVSYTSMENVTRKSKFYKEFEGADILNIREWMEMGKKSPRMAAALLDMVLNPLSEEELQAQPEAEGIAQVIRTERPLQSVSFAEVEVREEELHPLVRQLLTQKAQSV